jgi:colicin import membrane protein
MSRETVSLRNENWKSAFAGALGVHVAVVLLCMVTAHLWERPRHVPLVYTVRLFETVDMPVTKVEKKTAPSTSAPKPRTVEKKAASPKKPKSETAETKPPPPAKPKPKDVVSLKPAKPKKPAKPEKKAKDIDNLLKKRLQGLEKSVKEREAEARLEKRLSALEAQLNKRAGEEEAAAPAGGRAGGQELDELTREYLARVYDAVRSHWILPEQLLDAPLVCVVLLQIAQDGSVLDVGFESASGYALFDQSAIRAVQEASPLPPLPKPLGPGPMEIGLRFKPGEVGM